MHMASGTISEIHLTGLSDFDWSPDSPKAVLGAWVAPDENSLEAYKVYVGDITCDDITHKCGLSAVDEVSNVGKFPSWIPGTQRIVSIATRSGAGGNKQTLLLTDIQGNVVQEIDPELLDPSAATVGWPKGSVDGRYIGFVGPNGSLFIVDLNKMSVRKITPNAALDLEVVFFEWLD
jgi:hypothetical protein